MPIPNPILDDRSYQQLRDELVRRIPVYAPEWTDHNASDPGITLVELFAFLGENLLYRFNQIPESARLEFLRLLQIPLRPAAPAETLVTFTTNRPDGALVPVATELRAGDLPFETASEVHVWPVSFVAVARVPDEMPNQTSEAEANDFAVRALDALGLPADGTGAAFYRNLFVSPEDPPVDFGHTVDGRIWIAVLGEKGVDPTQLGGAVLNLGLVLNPVFPSIDQAPACPGPGSDSPVDEIRPVASPPDAAAESAPKPRAVEWRISKGGPITADGAQYGAVLVVGDTTRGLTRDGVIRLKLPDDPKEFGNFEVPDADVLGTGDLPPALDEVREKRLLFWLHAFRTDGIQFGKVLLLGANATEASQTVKARAEFLGTGTAQPGQRHKLTHTPVVPGSVRLGVEESGTWTNWTETDGFSASRPDDHHFTVDAESGEVRFGNGLQGFPPQIGQRIRVTEYRHGGGTAGNVPPKAISKIVPASGSPLPDAKPENPLRARFGADGESIEAALSRIPGEFRRHDRAVTAGDFQELALATPGSEVGRAECLPRFHPPSKHTSAAGVVSVVVWPREDPLHPNAPVPDRSLLRAVCAWLDRRRLVTTELYVIPPTYRSVAVAVGLEVKPGYGLEAVRRWVELVLRQYLAPLPPYGPEGQGWPLGRPVIGAELEAAALQVEGVRFLTGLKLLAKARTGDAWVADSVQLEDGTIIGNSVALELYEVPELAHIVVVEGPVADLDPTIGVTPPPAKVAVPVPILRTEC